MVTHFEKCLWIFPTQQILISHSLFLDQVSNRKKRLNGQMDGPDCLRSQIIRTGAGSTRTTNNLKRQNQKQSAKRIYIICFCYEFWLFMLLAISIRKLSLYIRLDPTFFQPFFAGECCS